MGAAQPLASGPYGAMQGRAIPSPPRQSPPRTAAGRRPLRPAAPSSRPRFPIAREIGRIYRAAWEEERSRPVFRGHNLTAQTTTAREVVTEGPAGTGKSLAWLNRIHRDAEKHPRSRQLIVRKTRSSLTEAALVTFEEKVLPPNHPALFGAAGERLLRRNRQSYDYPNGATVVVGGMDQPTRIYSTEYDRVYWQELTEGTEDEWQSLHRALRNGRLPFAQLCGDCNPDAPTHWIQSRAKGPLQLLPTRHEDNPYLWDEPANDWTPAGREYMGGLDSLTGVLHDRLRCGLWVAATGAIYSLFQRTGPRANLIPRFTPPDTWRVVLSIDFGFNHPFAAGVWVVDGDGRMYLEHEIYMSGRTDDQHVPAIKRALRGRSYEGVADSAEPKSIANFRNLGIFLSPSVKGPGSVNAGINQVQARMRAAGDGRPRLFVMDGALVERDEARAGKHLPICILDEFGLYRWKLDANGHPTDEPIDEYDDGCAQMRYAVQHVDGVHIPKAGLGMSLGRPAVYATERSGWGA